MKITALAKILISILFLVVVPTSCEKEKLAIAKKTDNTAEIKRLTIIGDNYFDKSEFSKAFEVYEKILSISDSVKNRTDYVDALISIGYIYQFQGDYIQSQATATKILPHLKHLKKTRFASNTYNLLGYAYLNTHDFEAAISYYKKAYSLKTSEWRKLNALSNIALSYMYKRDYHKAIDIYTKLIAEEYYTKRQKANTFEDFELVAFGTILDNLGICYFHTNNPKALYYFNKALEIRLKTNDLQDIAFSYSNLSGYYLKKNPDLAKKYALTSYKIACKINNFRDKKYSLINLIESSNGNDAKKYTNLYIQFTDSINKIELNQKNQFANIKYDFKKDKEENLELKTQKAERELEIQRQKNRSFISYITLFIIFFLFIFVVFYMIRKGRRERNDAVFKNEIRISNRLDNELQKEIQGALSFAENKNLENTENKEEFLIRLNRIYSKTRNISRENSAIQTDENFSNELKEMISGYTNQKLNIIVNGLNTFSWSKIDRVKKITVFRVLQEILDEMKTLNNASLASLTFKKEEKNILIMYVDNGTQIDPKYIILEKRLQNVENRIKTIKGTLNFDPYLENGFKVNFKFPI